MSDHAHSSGTLERQGLLLSFSLWSLQMGKDHIRRHERHLTSSLLLLVVILPPRVGLCIALYQLA